MIPKKELIGLAVSFLFVAALWYQISAQNEESPARNITNPMAGLENIGEEPTPAKLPVQSTSASSSPSTLTASSVSPTESSSQKEFATPTKTVEKGAAEVVADFFTGPSRPQSFQDIVMRAKPMQMPKFADEHIDGSLAGVFKGFLLTTQNQYQRIRLSASYSKPGAKFFSTMTLQTAGAELEFDSEKDMQQMNFGTDLYSYVFKLSDQRVLYIKYFNITSEGNPGRVLSGWLFTPSTKTTERVALIDESIDETDTWPAVQQVIPFLPKILLR